MSVFITPNGDQTKTTQIIKGGIAQQLQTSGRLPPVSIIMTPLDGKPQVVIDRFLSYEFNSSILVPVDTFSFAFAAPDDPRPFNQIIQEGDLITLFANGVALATGIVDTTEIEVDREFGEKITVTGRDLMGQLEDQDVVSLDSSPIWANKTTLQQVVKQLIQNTRVRGLTLTSDAPKKAYLFAATPGESKLAALQRFLEGLNCISFMDATGNVVLGRPNMVQKPAGTLQLSKERRDSNVESMSVNRAAATIPNVIVPVWTGQETVQDRVGKSQALSNSAPGPARLLRYGHRLPKAVVVDNPSASSPSELSDVNKIQIGGSNLLQFYAQREIARQNQKEMIVQAVVPGHYNDMGEPFRADTVYQIEFDRGGVSEAMYLFSVQYTLSEEAGQKTHLSFCRKGTIVADVRAQ